MTTPQTPSDPKPPRKSARQEPNPLTMVGVGMEFAGVVLVLTLGGWWLDSKWGSSPLCTLIGLGVGLVGGVYNLWRVGKRFF